MANPYAQYIEEERVEEDNPYAEYAEQGPKFASGDYGQASEAEVGDWESFWFSFNRVKNLTESAGDVMEQQIPLGRLQFTDPDTGDMDIKYIPPSEELRGAVKRGDEEAAAAILNVEREDRLTRRFPHLYTDEGVAREDAKNTAGTIAGAVLDPTSLIPLAGGLRAATAMGAGIGALDGALYSQAMEGKVDPTAVGLGTIIGGALPSGLRAAGVPFRLGSSKIATSAGNRIIDKYEKALLRFRSKGEAADLAEISAMEEAGVRGGRLELQEIYKATGRHEPPMPEIAVAADTMRTIEDEAGRNWLKNGFLNASKAIEPYVGTVSTRVRGISPKIFHALRRADLDTHVQAHRALERTEPFSRKVSQLQKKDEGTYKELKRALMGEDTLRASAIMRQLEIDNPAAYKGFSKDFGEVRKLLDEMFEGYKNAGYKVKRTKNYFPKLVKNPAGLGVVRQSIIKKALDKAEKAKGKPLSRQETSSIINRLIARSTREDAKAKVSKSVRARKYHWMHDEMMPHYAEINDSLHAYLRNGVHDIQRRKWLQSQGANFKKKADPNGFDIEGGIGNVVRREQERLNLSAEESDQLLRSLRARFGKGEQASTQAIQKFKNISYGTTLGNVFSAVTQFGDNAFGMYLNGVDNHLRAMFSPKIIKKHDIGLSDIAEDLANDPTSTKRFLDGMLKYSGFARMDKFGKESLLNGAMRKYRKQLNTDAGRRQFVSKWGKYFDDDMPTLMKNLKDGNFNDDNVRLLLWHTLADVQPIGLSEMPEKYLNHPNGRVFYMLKTFTIKQFDLMRREIVQEMRKGNKAKAAKNLMQFGMLFGLINAGADTFKDFIGGREIDVTDNMVENLVKLVGVSRYQTGNFAKDGPFQVLAEMLLPPAPFIDKPAQALLQGKPEKALEAIPIAGKLLARQLED